MTGSQLHLSLIHIWRGRADRSGGWKNCRDQSNHVLKYPDCPRKVLPLFIMKKLLVVLIIIEIMLILLIMIHMLCLHLALLLCMVEVGLGEIILCLGKYAMNLLMFFMLATLRLFFHVKMQK